MSTSPWDTFNISEADRDRTREAMDAERQIAYQPGTIPAGQVDISTSELVPPVDSDPEVTDADI